MELYETKEWDEKISKIHAQAVASGGGGSNMAEPLYVPPGPIRIPDGLPPEEVARRKKESEGIREMLERAAAHSEPASN